MVRRNLPPGPWGLLKGNALTEPPEDMVGKMDDPPVAPLVEIAQITVSRHAETIFDHAEHALGPYIARPENTPSQGLI